MAKRRSPQEEAELDFVANLFFEVLDSIRYARGYFTPRYGHLETSVKLRTTYELKKISKVAAEFFYTSRKENPSQYSSIEAIEELKAEAIEQAL